MFKKSIAISAAIAFVAGSLSATQESVAQESVARAAKSVVRILFLPPQSELIELPMKEYEDKVENYFSKESFLGGWFRRVGDQCRKDKKEKCPVMADLIQTDDELLIPIGSAFLAGDQKTLYTAAHVWVRFDVDMKSLARADISDAQKKSKAQAELGRRKADFVLFGPSGEIVFDTYSEKDRATVRGFAVPELFYLLYPEHVPQQINDNFEFVIFDLSRPLVTAALEFAKINVEADRPNGLSMKYGTPLFSLGYPDRPAVADGASILPMKLSREYIEALESSPFFPKEILRQMEPITFSLDQVALPGMSGGPIVDEEGRVVSLNSQAKAVLPGAIVNLDDLKSKPPRNVLMGVPPRWLPGVGFPLPKR